MNLSADEKRRLLARVKRAEGQVAAIRRMIEGDTYCVNILTQIAAARGALGGVGEVVLRQHMETCVSDALSNGSDEARATTIDELVDVFSRYGGLGRR